MTANAGDACRAFAGASLGLQFDKKAKKDPVKDSMQKAVVTTENFLGDLSSEVEKYQDMTAQQNYNFHIKGNERKDAFDIADLNAQLDAGILSKDTMAGLDFLAQGKNLETFNTFSNTLTTADPAKEVALQNQFIAEFQS